MENFQARSFDWRIPSFQMLLDTALNDPGVKYAAGCSPSDESIELPVNLCRSVGFEPLLVELTLLPEALHAGPAWNRTAVTHKVCVADDEQHRVWSAYEKSLRLVGAHDREGDSKESIVGNRDLYRESCIAVALEGFEGGAENPPRNPLEQLRRPIVTTRGAYTWQYEIGSTSPPVIERIELLTNTFVRFLREFNVHDDLLDLYRNSILCVFPLQLPDVKQVLTGKDRHTSEKLGPGGAVFVLVVDIQGGDTRSRLDALTNKIRSAILMHLLRQSFGRYALFRKENEVHQTLGHVVKNALESTDWQMRLRALRSVLDSSPDDQLTVHRRVLTETANSLALLSSVHSLGHLSRLVSILESQDFNKVKRWYDNELLSEWEHGNGERILPSIAESIWNIAVAFCTAKRCPTRFEMRVVSRGVLKTSRHWRLNDVSGPENRFDSSKISFAPLRAGADAAHAALWGVIEPLINAITALEKEPKILSDAQNEPLRMVIYDNLPQSVDIIIGNRVSPARATQQLHLPMGLKLADQLLRSAHLGELDYFRPPSHEEDVLRYWVRVRYRAHELAKSILKEAVHEHDSSPSQPT